MSDTSLAFPISIFGRPENLQLSVSPLPSTPCKTSRESSLLSNM
jgi:hypothetical protein